MVHYPKIRQARGPPDDKIKIVEEESIAAVIDVSSSGRAAQVPELHWENHKEQEHKPIPAHDQRTSEPAFHQLAGKPQIVLIML